jgi:3-hydroxyacyl-CoA dehydrogenase
VLCWPGQLLRTARTDCKFHAASACLHCLRAAVLQQAGIGRIQSNLQTMAKKGRIPEAAAKAAAGRLRGTLSYDSFDTVDLVIEAAVEVGCGVRTALRE